MSFISTVLENAVKKAQADMIRIHGDDGELSSTWTVKGKVINGRASTRVHARLMNLPPYCFKPSLADISAEDVGSLMQIVGTVVKTGPVQMLETARTFKCSGKKGCKNSFVVPADKQQRNNSIQMPQRCPFTKPDGEVCVNTKLAAVVGASFYTDYQEIKLQEAAGRLRDGHIPRSLLVKLEHDLVDSKCQPGDEVVVVGSLLAQWTQQSTIPDAQCWISTALAAHSIRVVSQKGSSAWQSSVSGNSKSHGELDNFRKEFEAYWEQPKNLESPIQARDFICQAVCPQLYGLRILKLALLVTLIGGVSTDAYEKADRCRQNGAAAASQDDKPDSFRLHESTSHSDSPRDSAAWYGERDTANRSKRVYQEQVKTRRRDLSHLLLVGDAGVGKSQILRFAAVLCPRSVMTTGVGTTSAGLTCAAVREGNGKEFSLEAGALVLSDNGVCCIDEFGTIQDRDRTTIHEAMEQSTISVAKAGIVCKLNCRTTIIAVMNPRNCIYDTHASLAANTGLEPPLLSRFDMIFKLIDSSDLERDSKVTTYLLNRAIQGDGLRIVERVEDEQNDVREATWSIEKLRAYISVVKDRFQPEMSDHAAILLERHYESCRSVPNGTIPVTVRFLESLIRLSQAHARLLFRNTVTLEDAVAVIELMESTASARGGFDGGDDIHNVFYRDPMTVDFTDEADLDFLCFEYRLLERYQMLEYLTQDRRSKAVRALQQTYVAPEDGVWNPSAPVELDFAPAPLTFYPTNAWNVEPGHAGGAPPSQDHYGRFQFSHPNSTKKRRY